jgi:hypothetical protein
MAWECGLGEVADSDMMLRALQAKMDNLKRFPANAITPEGRPDETASPYSSGVSPRDFWILCAAAARAAEIRNEPSLREAALAVGEAVSRVIGGRGRQNSLYRAADHAAIGEAHYFGNLAVWGLAESLGFKAAAGRAGPTE